MRRMASEENGLNNIAIKLVFIKLTLYVFYNS